MNKRLISIVIPVYNEAPNLPMLLEAVEETTSQLPYQFELVFVDDGSKDNSIAVLKSLRKKYKNIHTIELARNFGKEVAVSAGLHKAKGEAAIIIDADLQMPPQLMKDFIEHWEKGTEVVIGVFASRNMSPLKAFGAKCFYKIMQVIGHTKITPNATDYRLLDRKVIDAFNKLTERNRITRGMIDWLGFKREYVPFKQEARRAGEAQYGYKKLVALALNSFTSYSLLPLKFAGYLGLFLLITSIPLGLFLFTEVYLLGDPLQLGIKSVVLLALLLVAVIGLVLSCLGLIALYIAHIHAEVTNRPLYVVRETISAEENGETEI